MKSLTNKSNLLFVPLFFLCCKTIQVNSLTPANVEIKYDEGVEKIEALTVLLEAQSLKDDGEEAEEDQDDYTTYWNTKRSLNRACYDESGNTLARMLKRKSLNQQLLNETLYWAVFIKKPKAVELLLTQGADVNARDKITRATPISLAAALGYLAIAQTLLAHGANVSIDDYEHNTPLHWAARNGHHNLVTLLIKHNAPLDVEDYRRRTPLDQALFFRNYWSAWLISRALEQQGARRDVEAMGERSFEMKILA